jgi:hypothetical protein
MKSIAVLVPLSFAIGAAPSFAQPPSGSPAAHIANPAAAQQPVNAPRATALNPAAYSGVIQAPSSATTDALRARPVAEIHDIGLTLYHGAAGDGIGARVCVINWGNVPTPAAVVENIVEHSTDGASFSYREFPRLRLVVPSLRPTQSHCYNIPARAGIFQRIGTRVEDNGDSFFDLERAEARSGAMRHANSLSRYVIAPAR